MIRFGVYPLVALTFCVGSAAAQTQEAKGTPVSRSSTRTPERDSALVRLYLERMKASRPQTAAEKARTNSTLKAIQAKLDSMGKAKKEEDVKKQGTAEK